MYLIVSLFTQLKIIKNILKHRSAYIKEVLVLSSISFLPFVFTFFVPFVSLFTVPPVYLLLQAYLPGLVNSFFTS